MKLLIGGSPCTYWSIAQTKNRETEASGMGWELFRNYVIARDKFAPDYFLYENNKSMSAAIREQITAMLGVEPVLINSALVSAQNRQRLYWVGKREADGSYSKVEVEQPEDRGILLRDILESGEAWREKGYTIDANYWKTPGQIGFDTQAGRRKMVAEPVGVMENGKAYVLRANYAKAAPSQMVQGGEHYPAPGVAESVGINHLGSLYGQHSRWGIFDTDGKAPTLTASAGMGGGHTPMISDPVRIGTPDGKSTTLCGEGGGLGVKTGLYAAPIMRVPEAAKNGYAEIAPGECVDLAQENSKTRRGRKMVEKSNCLTTTCLFYEYSGTLNAPIYEVRDGLITIKDKQYPIKLRDGCYIIRKLTVCECMRLQTVPESYEFPVSNSQAYKMLGNGWTVDVIAHIMAHMDGITTESLDVLSMYDGMACGHIALDKLGAKITSYFATEIDKYAIQTATHNFPDIVELGDAFQVRNSDWDIPMWLL